MPLPSSAAARIRTNELQNPPPAFDPDALADEIVKGAPAPKDAPPAAFDPDALADEIVTGKAPATPLAQALNPQPPAIVAPTDLTARGQKLWGDLYQQRLYQGHTEEDASAYATDQLSGILLQRSATDNTAFLNGPLGINTALREVRAGTDPSGLTHHAAEAFGPHYFNEDTQARRNLPTPEWKIASTPSERRAAANNWAADHIQAYRQSGGKAGLAPDVAAAKANEQFENNEPLLLPNASNPTTAVAQTDTHTDVALSSSVKQALTDVQRGVSKHTSDLANLAKDAIIDPFAYLGENVANAETEAGLPVAESAAKGLQAFRTYNLPDPLDAAAGYLGSIPDAPAPVRDWVHRIRLAQERDAGVLQGSVEIANQALPASWKIDPNDDGFINAVARIVVATPQHDQAPEPVTAELVAGTVLNSTTEAAKAVPRELRDLYTMNPSMSDATGRQAQNAASLMRAVSDPMQLVFQGVSTTPTGQESSIGQILRVVGSLSQGLVTTYVGRIADKTLTSLGAESYRQHRVPGQGGPEYEAPSWVETVVPLFNLGDFTHDYLTTIENGDGFTTETMHALDTVAYGTDWLSPEWLAEVRQGGRINNLLVTTATFADLLLPVDGLPGEALKHTAGAGSRFYDGYAMGRNANMERGQAAVLGAAHVYPWFTDKALSGDAAYVSGRTLAGDAGRQQMQDVRADAVARGDQKQVVAIDRALSGVDRDAPTVASAVLYRWWQKEVRSGRDPMASFSKTFAGTAIGQRMREMFTTLGVTAPAAPGGSPVEAVVRPLTAPLTDPTAKTLVSMGYTADQLAGMTEAVGRRRILEAVRPGESFTDTLAPEQSPARHAVVDYARSASDLARLEGHAPVGALPDELASTDPADADARGRILAHLAGEWNAPLGMAMAALQSALSYVDGNTGRTVRAPWPDPQGLASVSAKHMARAVNYLLRASPEQVWRNVEAFERGEPYRWINDIRAEEEANQWSRRIGPGPSDRAVLSILPSDHALREAMVGERQGEGKNRYQELARAGRDHLAALVDTQRAFRDTLKKATETARTAYSRAAHAANLDPVVPAGADIISSLRDLSARLTDPKVTAALVKNAEKVEQARAALRGMDERLGVAIRWLDARMRDARPPTTVDMAKLPGRVEVRKALRERAKAGGFTPEQVDVWLVVQDRIAQALVRLGVIEKADEWYRMHSFEDLAEGTTADATDVLRQEALPPMTAKELRERLARTNFIPTSRVLEILGDQRPEYLDAVAQFILEQREKVRAGLLTNRDVAKAYIMATASQGSGAMDARAVEQVIGSPLAPEFTVTSKRGQRLVRPEEAMAAWLFSPMGQRALDGIERGVFDEEAWQSAARVRKAFGDDRINNLNVLGDPKKGAANMRNIATVTAALNAAGGDWKKVEAAVTKLNGVATGKSPFIGHLLGFGEMPTLDAREINGWLTGRGDIGALTTDRANLARAFSGGIDSAPLARSFMEKIQDRFLALRKKGAPGTDLAPEVFGAIMHHWLWDKLGGTETTHEGLYKAMRFAQDTVSSPKGEIDLTSFAKTGQAIIRLAADADLSTLVHESAHLLRRILPAEHMRDVDAYVHERFGGWNIEAEEWFARQMEAVLQTGRMVVDIRDPVKAPGFLARINTALRIVAEVLTDIYKSGKLPDVSPVFKGWVEKFLDLHDEGELPPLETERRVHPTDVVPEGVPPSTEEARARRAAEDEARHRQQAADRLALEQVYPAMVKAVEDAATGRKWEPAPDMKPATREPVVRAAPTGWTMDSTRTALETVAGMAPGTDRRKFVHSQILPKIAKWLGLTKEETKAYDQRVSASKDTPDGDLAVLREMAARGGMEAAAPAPAPEAIIPAPEPPRTIIDRSEEIHALADELVARMDAPDRAKAKTRGERLATLVARSVMEHRGEVPPAKMGVPEAKQYLADTFGPAAYNDFASALQKAMVEHRAPKTATPDVHAQMDAARQEAARKATDLFLRKTVGAGEPPPTTRLYPPDIAHAVKAEPEPVTLPPGMPETVLVKPVSVVGTAELDFRGRPRVQYDSKGESYHVAIRMEDARDVLPSHTLSGAETPGYDQRFQNREHGPERAAKLEESSRSNDVVRTLDPHQITPTNGASVFWRDPETGIKHILSGNGRDIRRRWVVERAALPEYQPLAAALHAEIAAIASTYGLGTPQPYHSIYLELVGATREQALNFARRSQEVEAAAQRPVAEVSGAARTFRALSDAKLEIDINTIPAVLTKENIQAFVAANRNSFWSFLALDTPDIQARSDLFQIGGEPLLKAASAALLSMVDDASERRITRYGQEAASLLATVAPILVTVRQFVAEKPELHPYDVSTYFADAMELWQRAQIEGNTSPETMSAMAERLHGQRSLTSATPLAVSQMSLLLAMAFAQKSTERGVGGLMRELSQAAEKGMRPSLFGRATDHVGIALRVLAGDTKNLDTIRTFAPQIPAVHADAIEIARQKGVQSVVAVEALRTADNPIPTEPQGHADVVGLFPKGDVLSQNRAYTEAVTTSGPNDPLVKDPWVRDHSVRAPAAIATRSGETNPAGVILSEYRGKPLLDRRQLNLALGYKGDQMTYTAADVGARVFAHAVVSILQNQEHRDAYVRTEGRVAVPLRRAAAVRGRALALLGDLPKSIRENIWTLADVRDPATGAVTSTIRERRQVQASDPHDAREVVRLPPESAHRVRLLLDSLETSGWWDSLPTSVRFLTLDDLMHGEDPARPGSRDFTTEHFRAIVGALQDAQSGVAPFRGRAERFNIASHLIWYHTRRPGGSLTPPPLPRDASLFEKATYTARSTLGGLVLNAANYVLPWDQYQRDMPEPMRPAYEEFRREVGRLPGDFVQKYEAVLETMRKGNPTALLDAFRQMVHTRAMDGFDPPISVDASQGASLLQRLRGWIYEDVDPRTPNAPYVRQGQISAHDRARSAPITLAEILAHRDLVDAVLRGTHDMDGTVAELLTQLRAGTIQADGAAYLLGHVYAKLGAAEKMGEDILVAAAGESGAEDATIQKLKNSNLSGLALDAYEAFFMGEWEKPTANVPDRSVAHLVGVGLGVGRVVDTPRWVAEVMMKQATAAAYDRFIQRVIDERYVLDLREIYRLTTDPGATVPTLPVLVHFGQDVRKAVTQILNGQDYALYEARDVTGRTYYGRDNATGISSEARAAAHAMIGRMGLRPDVSAVRASIKGELIPSILDTRYDAAVQKAMGNPDEILRLISEDVRGARPASVDISYSGRDDLLGTILTAEIRDLIRAQSPVGKNLAGILSHRSALEKLALTVKEYNSQMKGQLITGGPNGWAATAMAMSALAGGATAAGVGATFLGVHALGYLPRLAAYTNQVVDAFFQHWMGTGAKLMARTFTDPTIMRLSAAGMAHSLRLHRIARPLEIAMRAVSSRVNSANDRTCFTTASGAVWSVHDLVQFAERNALDGTQARFESGEGAQRAIDRMIREYGPSTQTGRLLQTVMGFYGRHKLAENYRKVYEGVDTYFRYAVLTRGLMDGMNPHDAIQLSLRTNFDFSAVAPLDRTVGKAFLFWMAQRRMIDLTLATLIEHPTRVLGPIRFARMQNLVANIEDDTEDHNVVAETVSDEGAYAPALTYLPVGNANQAAFKVILQEPAQVKAMRFMDMLFSADPALVGQMHPFVGLGYNVLSASFGGSYIDFFKRRVVTGDQNWKVYPSFVMFNQRLNGGSINDQFSFVPVAQPDGSWVFEVSGGNVGHLKFDALRQAVPGVSTWMSQMNQYDAAGGPQEAFVNDLSRLMQMIDPHVAGDPLTVTMGGGRAIVPADKAVRPALGSWWESVAPLGVKFVPVDTVRLARERPAIQAAKAIEAKQKETPTVLPAPGKPASLGPEVPNPATTLETVQPGKGMGL